MIQTTHPVLEMASRIAANLQQREEIQRFRAAEEQINSSQTVKKYIDTIKKKQKELVHAKHYQKHQYIKQLEAELDRLNQEFDQLPIVREYQQYQVDINVLLQTMQQTLVSRISKDLYVESGGEVASGCGSGGACGCRD